MKKLILVAVMAIFSLSVSGQSTQKVPEFMGIKIEGNVRSFESKLQSKGYKKVKEGEFKDCFIGEFLNQSVVVILQSSPKSKLIYQVAVVMGKEDRYSLYDSEMSRIKELYDSKYGKGDLVERYTGAYSKGDGYELQALKYGNLTYGMRWKNPQIYISLNYEFGIMIFYTNVENEEIANKELENANFQDI